MYMKQYKSELEVGCVTEMFSINKFTIKIVKHILQFGLTA